MPSKPKDKATAKSSGQPSKSALAEAQRTAKENPLKPLARRFFDPIKKVWSDVGRPKDAWNPEDEDERFRGEGRPGSGSDWLPEGKTPRKPERGRSRHR